jgi:hypothetical protein
MGTAALTNSFNTPVRPPGVMFFDVAESLLDLLTLTAFVPALVRRRRHGRVLTIAGVYIPFTDVGGAVLDKIAAQGVKPARIISACWRAGVMRHLIIASVDDSAK